MSQQRFAIVADTVFDGTTMRRDCAVVIADGRIEAVAARSELPSEIETHVLAKGAWLAPGLIDIQVNGGGDVLFNDAPTVEGIAAIAAAHRRFGTTALLPTLITDTDETMKAARDSVAAAMGTVPGVLGIHFEGPFLSPGKSGVHDSMLMRMVEPWHRELMTSLPNAAVLVTLAPECVPHGFIRALTQKGVRVALGHSMATYEETKTAIGDGLTGFTHLFNAMRGMSARDPGPIAAALESPSCWIGLIVDGVHVEPAVLRLALRGRASPMLVTDAMPSVGGTKGRFALYGREIVVTDGRCVTAGGTLAGSNIDMATAVRNCVALLGAPLEDALRFASRVPAEFLGMGDTLGRIAPGYRADLVALQPETVRIIATWMSGDFLAAE